MVETIHDIVTYLLYLMLLTAAANTTKDLRAYPFHRSLSDIFLTEGEPMFEDVSAALDFMPFFLFVSLMCLLFM